jgi:hypothetical protein
VPVGNELLKLILIYFCRSYKGSGSVFYSDLVGRPSFFSSVRRVWASQPPDPCSLQKQCWKLLTYFEGLYKIENLDFSFGLNWIETVFSKKSSKIHWWFLIESPMKRKERYLCTHIPVYVNQNLHELNLHRQIWIYLIGRKINLYVTVQR